MIFESLLRLLPGLALTFSLTALSKTPVRSEKLLGLPERPNSALTGSQFIKTIEGLPQSLREQRIVEEVLAGNIPEFQRDLVPVERTIQSGPYRGRQMRYWVLPDYLAIGSDADFVRVPLNMTSIRVLSQKLNLSIPTTVMVDDIYAQADVKLKPTTLPSSRTMASVQYFEKHNELVQHQMEQSGWKAGMLVAGHKKDVVQSLRLLSKPGAVAIYGWHTGMQEPIQPLSTVHGGEYADYSHGVRFVSNTVEVNGKTMDLRAVLSQKLSETVANKPLSGKPRS